MKAVAIKCYCQYNDRRRHDATTSAHRCATADRDETWPERSVRPSDLSGRESCLNGSACNLRFLAFISVSLKWDTQSSMTHRDRGPVALPVATMTFKYLSRSLWIRDVFTIWEREPIYLLPLIFFKCRSLFYTVQTVQWFYFVFTHVCPLACQYEIIIFKFYCW